MAFVNIDEVSDGDGIKTLVFRADRDYILDAASLASPSSGYYEIEVSNNGVRNTGVYLKRRGNIDAPDRLLWSGWLILREGEFVMGHIDGSANNNVIVMRLHLNAITIRFQAALA